MSEHERVIVVIVRLGPIDPAHPGGEHALPEARDMIVDAVARAMEGARVASDKETDLAAELDAIKTSRVQAIENDVARRVEAPLQESYDRLKERLADVGATGLMAGRAGWEFIEDLRDDAKKRLNRAMGCVTALWQHYCPSEDMLKSLGPKVVAEVIWRAIKELAGR